MSAVITLGIVLMWAVVLVPMWLRRHEKVDELHSVDRFSGAMRVLSRRDQAVGDRRWVVMPARRSTQTAPVASVKGAPAARRRGAGRAAPAESDARSGRPALARRPARRANRQVRRRRRTLIMLVAMAAATGAAMFVLGGAVLYAQLAADALLLVGVVRTRSLVAAERRRRLVRARRDARLRVQMAAVRAAVAHLSPADKRPQPVPVRVAEPASEAPPLGAAARPAASRPAVAATTPTPLADDLEQAAVITPVGPTPPTDQPAAPAASSERPRRVVDLTRPGEWTERRDRLFDDAETRLAPDEDSESELDDILERRRAVNG